MQSIKYLLIYFLFLFSIYSHHTGAGLDTTLFNFRFLNNEKQGQDFPPTFFIFSTEWNRGAKENKDIYNNTVYVESFFMKGAFTINANMSYLYYDQKDRSDAGRYGKPGIGSKIFPFYKTQAEKNFFVFIEPRINFATGPDNTKFIESNYYTGSLNLAGGYAYQRFSFVTRIGGEFPLTKNTSDNSENNLPNFLRLSTPNTSNIELKKVTSINSIISYSIVQNFSIFTGFLYRTPFNGVEKEISTGDRVPLIFREGTIGMNYVLNEKYIFTLSYKHPFNRGREFRPYESSLLFAFSFSL
jgi:hypothetical protein